MEEDEQVMPDDTEPARARWFKFLAAAGFDEQDFSEHECRILGMAVANDEQVMLRARLLLANTPASVTADLLYFTSGAICEAIGMLTDQQRTQLRYRALRSLE